VAETRTTRGSGGNTKGGRTASKRAAAPTSEPTSGDGASSPGPADRTAGPPICTVAFCPICLAVTAAQGAAPDAIDHLLRAARELFLAARVVLDARAEDLAGAGDGPSRLERIEIA
jgi:hypothetical protein